MTDAEWEKLDLKGKLDALSAFADDLEDDNFHAHSLLMRMIVKIGEDKLSVDTILRTVLKWGEEGLP